MNILRTFLTGLAGFICISAISAFVYLVTFQTTLMDRAVVKSWLSESKIYEGGLVSALVQTGNEQADPAQAALTPSPETLKNSLNATFSPAFTKTHIEGVIDSAYDWMEGKTSTFAFSIPVDQERDTFIQQLSKALEPQLATLPICESLTFTPGGICRPATMSIEQFANRVTSESLDASSVFNEPITNESFVQNAAQTSQPLGNSPLTQLPAIREAVDLLLILLPVIAIVSGAAVILATQNQRLAAATRLSRRIFFGMLFILIPAAIIAFIAKSYNFNISALLPTQNSELLIPLIKSILVGIFSQLALISGIITIVSMAAWIILRLLEKKRLLQSSTNSPY